MGSAAVPVVGGFAGGLGGGIIGSKIGSSIGKLIGKAIDSFTSNNSSEQKDAVSFIKDLINKGVDPELILMAQKNDEDKESIMSMLKNIQGDVPSSDQEKIDNLLKLSDENK